MHDDYQRGSEAQDTQRQPTPQKSPTESTRSHFSSFIPDVDRKHWKIVWVQTLQDLTFIQILLVSTLWTYKSYFIQLYKLYFMQLYKSSSITILKVPWVSYWVLSWRYPILFKLLTYWEIPHILHKPRMPYPINHSVLLSLDLNRSSIPRDHIKFTIGSQDHWSDAM